MNGHKMTDEQLLRGCKEKNLSAQKQFYDRFAKKMMGVCLRYADSAAEAQDILQDGFIKVFERIESYKATGSLEGWIKRIMVNTALDNFRRRKQERNNIELDVNDAYHNSYEEAQDNISAKELLGLIQKLPAGYRTVFNLFAIEGYSHKEISELLGIHESTSKSQYSRAKMHLQKTIQLEKIY
ncbi:MAG TPA: sigma-70 family RNA polymerase sigma factor [Bacteroidia bacterium]|nr:sigma-70 family RNA polymerase sigma factor [Bacteroidia bacterium]